MKLTQHQLIIEYIKEHGSILPAKDHGFAYKQGFLGSELSKRCRELRKKGILYSIRDGKFERFYLDKEILETKYKVKEIVKNKSDWWEEAVYQRPKEVARLF